jgi:hypothetical protein
MEAYNYNVALKYKANYEYIKTPYLTACSIEAGRKL